MFYSRFRLVAHLWLREKPSIFSFPGLLPRLYMRAMRKGLLLTFLLSIGLAGFVACGPKKTPPKEPAISETVSDGGADDAAPAEPPKPKALVERLGGREGIAKVVDTFVKNVAADNKINKRFAKVTGAKLEKFKANLTDQICEAASPEGAPVCKY